MFRFLKTWAQLWRVANELRENAEFEKEIKGLFVKYSNEFAATPKAPPKYSPAWRQIFSAHSGYMGPGKITHEDNRRWYTGRPNQDTNKIR